VKLLRRSEKKSSEQPVSRGRKALRSRSPNVRNRPRGIRGFPICPSTITWRSSAAPSKRPATNHITNLAAALAYYAFLAIPSVLLVGLGVFSLLAGPDAISTLIDKLGTVMPGEATSLLRAT
jgi:hypothetical protein